LIYCPGTSVQSSAVDLDTRDGEPVSRTKDGTPVGASGMTNGPSGTQPHREPRRSTGHGLSRSRSGRGNRPYSHPHSHAHGGKSMDHSITQFAEIDDANVSALQQVTRGGGGLTMASQWKSQFDDSEETDNEWKGAEPLQSPEHNKNVSMSQVC